MWSLIGAIGDAGIPGLLLATILVQQFLHSKALSSRDRLISDLIDKLQAGATAQAEANSLLLSAMRDKE